MTVTEGTFGPAGGTIRSCTPVSQAALQGLPRALKSRMLF
jgi:hypothetical protein